MMDVRAIGRGLEVNRLDDAHADFGSGESVAAGGVGVRAHVAADETPADAGDITRPRDFLNGCHEDLLPPLVDRLRKRELDDALTPFRKVRQAVGDKIDIMAELHALWLLPPAREIVRALDQFTPRWIEDPVRMDHLASLGALSRAARAPIAAGETLGGRGQFRTLLEMNAVGLAIMDLAWGGGLSEARKVAAMCEAWHVPFAAHDCTGPVTLAASTHLALATHNVFTQEIVRAFYYGWYADIVTALPPLADGHIAAPEGPGLGLALLPDFRRRADVAVRRSAA